MNRILIPVVMYLALGLVSCKKDDYKNDGGVHDPHVNMTTYDYLKSKPQFSTLIKLIDRAGLKDEVNKAKTFLAVTNYSADDYVDLRYRKRAVQLNDPNITYTMDSIPVQQVRDSLKMYIYADDLGRDKLTLEGKYYTPLMGNIPGSQFYMKLRRSRDYGDYLTYVDYVRVVRVVKTLDNLEADPDAIPNDEKDMEFDCQTSGIISTTGIIHVIANNHRMFFNREEKPQL